MANKQKSGLHGSHIGILGGTWSNCIIFSGWHGSAMFLRAQNNFNAIIILSTWSILSILSIQRLLMRILNHQDIVFALIITVLAQTFVFLVPDFEQLCTETRRVPCCLSEVPSTGNSSLIVCPAGGGKTESNTKCNLEPWILSHFRTCTKTSPTFDHPVQ